MATVASLVVQIGADIADLKKNVEKVDSTIGGISATAKKVGIGLAAAFTVDAIVGAATKIVDFAGELTDLSAKTGIGTKALQEFKYAGGQVGVELGQITKAVTDFQKRIAGGDASAERAVTALGLSFADLRKLSPEDQFKTLAARVAEVEDPAARVKLAVDLFGKSGAELLPLMTKEFVAMTEKANTLGIVMDEETVASMDTLGDTMSDLMSVGMAMIGKVLTPFVPLLVTMAEWGLKLAQVLGDSLGWAVGKLSDLFSFLAKAALGAAISMVEMLQSTVNMVPGLSKVMGLNEDFGVVLGTLRGLQDKFTGTQNESTDATKKATGAIQGFLPELDKNAGKLTESQKAAQKYTEEIKAMAFQYSGGKLAAEVVKLADAVKETGGAAKMTAFEKEKLGKQLADLQSQGAKLTPELQKIVTEYNNLQIKGLPVVAVTQSIAEALKAVKQVALSLPPLAPVMTLPTKEVTAADVLAWQEELIKKMKEAGDKAGKATADSFTNNFKDFLQSGLPTAILGAIQGGGDVIAAAGSSIGSFLMSDKGIGDTITKGAKDLFGDKLGAAIGSALPGLGAMIGPMISGLFGKLFGSAGRDSVEEFAKSMGGFASLREKLLPLGDVGEKLWVNLTQGVGKNNPAQAQAAIEAITKALQEQEALIDGLVPSWQDTLSLAEKYGIEVAGLGEKFEQARLAEMANDIAIDFRKLIAAGADMNAVLIGMQDEVQGVVTNALKMGLDIPDSMKPIIQKLIDMGQLTDENGNKLTDMSKLNFSEALSKSVERIIEALDRLIETLGGGVKKAIDDLPKDIKINVGWNVGTIPVKGDAGEHTSSFHNGGWVKAHTGMNKVLGAGEVPIIAQTGEAILNRRAAARLGESGVANLNGGGAGGGSVVDFGAFVAEMQSLRAEQRRAAAAAPAATARAVRDALLLAR